MVIEIVAGAGIVAALYKYRTKTANLFRSDVSIVANKGSAFARVAEQEGKLIALKAVSSAKKAEALAAHSALDEVDKLLG